MNIAPDYSAAYIILKTDIPDLEGHGHTFTIGRGNEICVKAIESISDVIKGKYLDDITNNWLEFYYSIVNDSQLRWIGPEKGAIHLATAALFNALWDLKAKYERKPLWQLICNMSPDELIAIIDFKYIEDALTKNKALEILLKNFDTREQRIQKITNDGYPAYTTSAGWLGYSTDKLKSLCRKAKQENWKYVKFKVGSNLEEDISRLTIARDILGDDIVFMIDANQVWGVDEAIDWVNSLKKFNPWFIEEPTSPDDILGHKKIRESVKPIMVATGEHCHNKVMFKQFFQANAIDICQLDSCRLGSLHEILAVQLLAENFNKAICPHAGGVGLCEYVQHLAIIDYVCVSADLKGRVLEYIDHLHENFLFPCKINHGAYVIPRNYGYSATIKKEAIDSYKYPNGSFWIQNIDK
jgi:L-fuconate dehydratase